MRIPLAKRLYDESDGIAPERVINCWAQVLTQDQFKGATYKITHVPGLGTALTAVSAGACRGLFYDPTSVESDLIGVWSNSLYTIDSSWTLSSAIGTLASSTRRARFAASASEVAILSASTLYSWNGTTLTTVTDADKPTFEDIVYIGQRFVGLDANTQNWFYSDSLDATSWTALGYISSEVEADRGVGACVDAEDLILFGRATIEFFGVTTDADNPFQRRVGAVVARGCLSRDSIVRADNSVCFVGDDRIVYRLDGYTPVRISKRPLERAIGALTNANQALIECATFSWDGQTVLQVSLPSASTWWFNFATGEWNERATASQSEAECRCYPENRQKGGSGTAFGVIVTGGRTSNLYKLSNSYFVDNASAITRTFTAFLPSDSAWTPVDTVGLRGTPGRISSGSPEITLSLSRDGGQSFGTGLDRSIGDAGEYTRNPLWQGLGMTGPQGMVMKFATSAACAYDVLAVCVNEGAPV